MQIKLAGWIVIGLLLIIIASVVWYLFLPKPASTPAVVQPTPSLPVGGAAQTTPVATSSSSRGSNSTTTHISITDRTGAQMVVNDFIHNGTTLADASNSGNYLLAGNLGYCISDPQKCQAAEATDFSVYYNGKPQSFTITLTAEPIGTARLHMEQFMLTTLGVSQSQLCNLNYLVGVTRYVNSQYTGRNLGFSFCPGATKLPQ